NIQGDGCYDEIGTSCNYGCSNGACNTCKADGQTCSTPGSSTAECCSGNCQMDGKCGTDICTNGCLSEGSTRCIDSNTKQTCGDYDTDICLEWGNNIECDDGCVNNNCHHCNIPDGSSYSCDCNSDVECAKFGDYYCNQVSGPDACEPIIWQDDCSNHGEFFCENGDVYQCVSNGKKYEKKLTDACGINKFCDTQSVEGTGKCSIYPTHMDMWVDYAGIGVDVNKQPNDKLKLNIYSERGASANLQYDSSVFSGDCPNGLINLVAGENSCSLTVKGSAEKGKYKIVLNERFTIVNIIYYPSLVILTDSKKLNERFSSQPRGVNSLLSQAYQNAENDGVVYDLSQYYGEIGKSNPFNSFGSYNEKISQPYMTDNSYSAAVGEFVSSKCIDCSDVMVVGDDYVVPYYRRSIETVKKSWIFWEKKEIKNIYTDTPYSQKKVLPFSNYYEMFKINGKYDGKNVLVITPHDVTPEQRTQIDRLKKAFEDKRYNPDFTEMDGKDAYCVDERWFAEVKGKTVIIIGTEENNNAFKCMPFVAGDVNRDAAFMQPNVWDNDEYALVINTNDANVLGFFSKMVEDGNLVELKGESAYMFHIGVQYAGYAAMGVGVGALIVFSGGTAAPAVLLTAGVILDGIADATDVVDSCYVNQDGVGWCGAAIGFAAIPLVSSGPGKQVIRSFDDAVLNNRLMRMFENVDEFINKYFKRLRSSKSIGDEAFEQVAKTIEDNRYMAKGSARFIGDNLNKLDNMPFSQVDNARFIKSIGETDDALEIGESYIKDIKIKKRIPSGAPGIYDRTTKEIIIAEEYLDGAGKWVKQDADELIEITAKHELSHAKIHEILNLQEGDSVFEHITDFDKPDVELIARRFDDLSTNKLLKNNLADNSNFVGKIKSVELDDVSDGLLNNLASGGEYDTLLQLKAEAHEFGDAALKNRIDSHIPVNLQNKFNLGDSDSLINRYIQGTSINEFGSPDEYLENMDSMVHEIKGLIQ
ncbi:MAG: hypothetical protein KJ561_04560, partial [Nanoarchaeota archaeon]|nr:hypothetical protein [Nanoarchaeota archaeon]